MRVNPAISLSLFMMAFFSFLIVTSWEWPLEARFFPWAIAVPALGLSIGQVILDVFRMGTPAFEEDLTGLADLPVDRDVPARIVVRRALIVLGWILGFLLAIRLFSFLTAVPLFTFAYVAVHVPERRWMAPILAAAIYIFMIVVFDRLVGVLWPEGWIWGGG